MSALRVKAALLAPLVIGSLLAAVQATGASAAAPEVHVQGSIHCHGGGVTGIWVNDSAGGSGWANYYAFGEDGVPSGDPADVRYGITLPLGTISFSVGCGGSTKKWGTTNNSPTANIASMHIPTLAEQIVPPDFSPAYTVNLFCGDGQANGPCHYPDPGKSAGQTNRGDKCQCTAAALGWWHRYEGTFPYWSISNAGSWGSTAAASGWDVTTVPMADSIVVFPDFGTGLMDDGHVGWVTGLVPGPDHTVIGLYVNQGNVKGDGTCSSGDTQYNTKFLFSDYPNGDGSFPAASSWRYIVATNN